MLDTLVLRWGYWAVGVGTMLEGETVLLAAGALAHKGLLQLPWVMLVAFLGGVTNDMLWFFAGRHAGRPLLAKWPRLARHAGVVDQWIARNVTLFVLSFRFLPGVRTVGPILLGAGQFPIPRFLLLNALGAAGWSVAVGFFGYGLGASLHALLGRATHAEEAAAVGLAVAVTLWLVVKRREKSSASHGSLEAQFKSR